MRVSTFKDRRGFHIPDDNHRENKLSHEERKHIDHLVFNRWPPLLTGGEQKVVMFIYARTILHYQRWAYVSLNTLTFGFPYAEHSEIVRKAWEDPKGVIRKLSASDRMAFDEGDVFVVAPTGLSKSGVRKALDSLLTKGFVVRNPANDKNEMALNPDTIYCMTDVFLPRNGTETTKDGRRAYRKKLDIR